MKSAEIRMHDLSLYVYPIVHVRYLEPRCHSIKICMFDFSRRLSKHYIQHPSPHTLLYLLIAYSVNVIYTTFILSLVEETRSEPMK